MKSGNKFKWAIKNTNDHVKIIWSEYENKWIPGEGICTVISNINGLLTYQVDNSETFTVHIKEAIIPTNIMEYPIDYAYPKII